MISPSYSSAAPADVTGVIQGGIGDGCQAADFAGFSAGNVALMARGDCMFSEKMTNAAAAGSLSAIIYNNPTGDTIFVTASTPQSILGFFISHDLGIDFENAGLPVTVRMFADVESVNQTPLPAALPLFAGGLGVIGLLVRRRKRKQAA